MSMKEIVNCNIQVPNQCLYTVGLGYECSICWDVFFSSEPTSKRKKTSCAAFYPYVTNNMGVSLNGGTPKTPQNDHF